MILYRCVVMQDQAEMQADLENATLANERAGIVFTSFIQVIKN